MACHHGQVQLARSRDERVVAGVCAGIGHALGVDPVVVRVATVILSLGNGFGVLVYLVAWCVLPVSDAEAPPAPERDANLERALALGCITLGLLFVVREVAPVFPDGLVWPGALVATGIAVAWSRDGDLQTGWRSTFLADPSTAFTGRQLWMRLIVGGGLLVLGVGWFLEANQPFATLGNIALAVAATTLGIALLVGPWILRIQRQAGDERRQRIRSEERAEVAAHLHDSVLQTLALIQRHADSPAQARSLARRQERELRAWLFDDRSADATTLATALDELTSEVEANHDVVVDTVVVGDRPLDERSDALVGAIREAVVNAARHSGESEVSVYVEVTPSTVEAFVRDRGKGFDPEGVDGWERRGIRDSIVARMTRHGGTACVRSAPGEGTEVALHLGVGEGHPV